MYLGADDPFRKPSLLDCGIIRPFAVAEQVDLVGDSPATPSRVAKHRLQGGELPVKAGLQTIPQSARQWDSAFNMPSTVGRSNHCSAPPSGTVEHAWNAGRLKPQLDVR